MSHKTPRLRRRGFIVGALSLPALAASRPDTLVLRRVKFEELREFVVMSGRFPELLRTRDREAMAWLESGFETSLVFDLAVYEQGSNRLIEAHHRVTKLRYDYLSREYQVTVYMDGKVVSRRRLATREAAVEAAVSFRRVRIARTKGLSRGGQQATYYVTVAGLRNPIDDAIAEPGFAPGSGRAQGRDTRWFNSFVNFLAGDLPEAEATARLRTQPFYLVSE